MMLLGHQSMAAICNIQVHVAVIYRYSVNVVHRLMAELLVLFLLAPYYIPGGRPTQVDANRGSLALIHTREPQCPGSTVNLEM